MTPKIRAQFAASGVIALIVWWHEYGMQSGGMPMSPWWVGDIRRAFNSFLTSVVDYAGGPIGLVLWFSGDRPIPSWLDSYAEVLATAKATIDKVVRLDAWRFSEWDNRVANWLGHAAFSMIVIAILSEISTSRLSVWSKAAIVALLVLPLVGIFLGQSMVA